MRFETLLRFVNTSGKVEKVKHTETATDREAFVVKSKDFAREHAKKNGLRFKGFAVIKNVTTQKELKALSKKASAKDLNKRVTELESRNEALQNAVVRHEQAAEAAKNELVTALSTIDDLNADLQSQKDLVKELNQQITVLKEGKEAK